MATTTTMKPICAVCYDDLSIAQRDGDKRPVCAIGCGHVFHLACIMRWLNERSTCPQCMTGMTARNLQRLLIETEGGPSGGGGSQSSGDSATQGNGSASSVLVTSGGNEENEAAGPWKARVTTLEKRTKELEDENQTLRLLLEEAEHGSNGGARGGGAGTGGGGAGFGFADGMMSSSSLTSSINAFLSRHPSSAVSSYSGRSRPTSDSDVPFEVNADRWLFDHFGGSPPGASAAAGGFDPHRHHHHHGGGFGSGGRRSASMTRIQHGFDGRDVLNEPSIDDMFTHWGMSAESFTPVVDRRPNIGPPSRLAAPEATRQAERTAPFVPTFQANVTRCGRCGQGRRAGVIPGASRMPDYEMAIPPHLRRPSAAAGRGAPPASAPAAPSRRGDPNGSAAAAAPNNNNNNGRPLHPRSMFPHSGYF